MNWLKNLFAGLRTATCNECELRYKQDDGLLMPLGFVCCNCLRDKTEKRVTPIGVKKE